MSLSENEFDTYMEEVEIEIRKAPKMFARLQSRDELIKKLKQQRDDLLAACKYLLRVIMRDEPKDGSISKEAVEFANIAVKKAKPDIPAESS